MAEKKVDNKPLSFEEVCDKINKDWGKGSILTALSKPEARDVISTGSLKLDIATGIGGLARGTIVELSGWESSGKSTIAMNVLAETQKRGLKAVLIDAEHAFDKKYARALGIDVDKLIISQPDYGEAGYGIAISLMETGEVGTIVIDSQTALQPKKVMENEIGSSNLGLHAKLMSEVVLKILNAAAKYNVLVIFISQFREKIGVMFGSPLTTNGGNALKFYTQMRIEFWKTLDKEGDVAVANKTRCKVIKNKLASPHEEAKFNIVFGEGVDRMEEIMELAVDYSILKKAGSWYSYGDSNIAQGEAKLAELFNSNPEFYKEIEDKVLEKIKK